MNIIQTTEQTPRGPEVKYVATYANGNCAYTSKRELAQQFQPGAAEQAIAELHKNFNKTFTSVPA